MKNLDLTHNTVLNIWRFHVKYDYFDYSFKSFEINLKLKRYLKTYLIYDFNIQQGLKLYLNNKN